jgi:hypothetical protein
MTHQDSFLPWRDFFSWERLEGEAHPFLCTVGKYKTGLGGTR